MASLPVCAQVAFYAAVGTIALGVLLVLVVPARQRLVWVEVLALVAGLAALLATLIGLVM